MAETKETKTVRQPLAQIADLKISPARIRSFLDKGGINLQSTTSLNELKDELNKIKKEGGPMKPVAPEPLKKDRTESQKKEHDAAREKYETALAVYNKYSSERYLRLERIYKLCKNLNKLQELLTKTNKSGKQPSPEAVVNYEKELTAVKTVLADKPAPRKRTETADDFNKRVANFKSMNFAQYLTGVDLADPEQLNKTVTTLKSQNPGLELFFEKSKESKSRTRCNDAAAIALACAMEVSLKELLEFIMQKTIEFNKKTIQPDCVISADFENLEWFPFFRHLPHYQAVLARGVRRARYVESTENTKSELIRKARLQAKRDGKNFVKPKTEFKSFNEVEVEAGFAVKEPYTTVSTDKDGKETTVEKYNYLWYGIDVEREETNVDLNNFNHYVQQVCKEIINDHAENTKYCEIKISTSVKKFCSDLILDFIAKIGPMIRIMITAMDVKTIDDKVIKNVLKMLLMEQYHSVTGHVELKPTHQYLFNLIDKKVEAYTEHRTGTVHKEEHEFKPEVMAEAKLENGHANGHVNGHSNGHAVKETVTPVSQPVVKDTPETTGEMVKKTVKPVVKATVKPSTVKA